jgi:signal transduction histidine kinase
MYGRATARTLAALVILTVGCIGLAAHIYHLLTEPEIRSAVLGLVIPLGFSFLLIAQATWLYRSDFEQAHTVRVVGWTGAGLLAGVAFGYPVVPYQLAHGIQLVDVPFLLVTWATTGAVGGFLIGTLNARNVRYRVELEADRAALLARERDLERQNDRLENFATMVSHDLRNPLNVATGRLHLLREEQDSDHLDPAIDALERMESFIEDLLALAREGDPLDETAVVSLSRVATESWGTADTPAAELRIEDDLELVADPDRLRQLLEQLFRNAIDHGPDDVEVRVGTLEADAGFYVADDGPGIPDGQRGDVFEFRNATRSTETGFGLSIVTEIADAHGWEIEITESETGGARFNIRLPDTDE